MQQELTAIDQWLVDNTEVVVIFFTLVMTTLAQNAGLLAAAADFLSGARQKPRLTGWLHTRYLTLPPEAQKRFRELVNVVHEAAALGDEATGVKPQDNK